MTYSGRVPNFFVPGVQKAGTTYLCRQIARHPDIFFSKMKEPHFFHQKHFTEEQIDAEYLPTHFAAAGEERWVGEGSTRYFQSDEAAARIAKRLGTDLRFIVAFRQPTEKAVSLYLHNFKRGRLTGHESILQMKAGGIAVVPFSLFAHGCRTYIDTFGRERIHFMRYDDLVADPLDFVNSALGFLDLAPIPRTSEKLANAGYNLAWDGDDLVAQIPPESLAAGQVQPRFPRAELEELHGMFLEDVAETAALTGLDLDHWSDFPSFLNKPSIDPADAVRRGPGRQRPGGKGSRGKGSGARGQGGKGRGGKGPGDSPSDASEGGAGNDEPVTASRS
jgi:hypothetical protein